MSKQTAVEWLIVQIINDHNNNALTGVEWKKVFEQAKAMEREQIIIAHESGYEVGYIDNGKDGLTYYNETYKK